ncbi:MAG: hypothetical protein ACT4P7_10610 [Gemmatimonadaceae bacterium]
MKLSRSWKLNTRLHCTLAVACVLSTPGAIAAQGATITGTVTVAGSAVGLAQANVSIVGSTRIAITDTQGKYVLRATPVGMVEVRVTDRNA